MVVRKILLILACILGVSLGTARAQSDARIRIVVPSISQIEDDLKWLIELSPNQDLRKQWKKLKDEVLDAFEQGVDLTQPLEVDIVFRKDEMSYEYRIPATVLKDLTQSIEGMGFKFKNLAPEYFSFAEKGKKPYFLKYDKASKYAWITNIQTAFPAVLPPAAKEMAALLGLKKDVVAELKNETAGIDTRRNNFKELRKQFEALIKAQRYEDKNAFELRKLWLVQQLDEAERFIVETEELLLSWTTSSAATPAIARGEISLTALPGTDLLKSIQLVSATHSAFANVELHPSPLAVGRVNFPLDSMRTKHTHEFLKAVRPTLEKQIDGNDSASVAQRSAAKTAMNKFLDMLDAGVDNGIIDGFIDCHAVSAGKNVMVSAMRVADGKAADEIIKMLPTIKSEWSVEADKYQHGDVSVHELTIPAARLESFQRIFAGETKVLVGTSKNAVWTAAGVDALNSLKTAIDQAAKPAPDKVDPIALSYQIQLAKFITLAEIVQKEVPSMNPLSPKEQAQAQKDLEKHRKLAQDTMGNCESLMKGELKQIDNKIEGYIELNECVLRYLGSSIADVVKTTLQ